MKNFGSKRIGWVAATLALLALSLALATPKAFLVNAEAAEEGLESAADGLKDAAAEGMEVKLGGAGGEEGGEDDGGDDDDDEAMPGGTVQVLTGENFERITQVATGATGDWFIRFYAPWSGHCKKMEVPWNALAEKLRGKVNVGLVDATSDRALGERFGVKGFPTLLFFSHGKMYEYIRSRKLENLLEFATGGFKDYKPLPVPLPPNIGGGVQDMLSKVLKDLEGLKRGKSPSSVTLLALSGSLLVLIFVFMMMKAAKPSAPKTKGA